MGGHASEIVEVGFIALLQTIAWWDCLWNLKTLTEVVNELDDCPQLLFRVSSEKVDSAVDGFEIFATVIQMTPAGPPIFGPPIKDPPTILSKFQWSNVDDLDTN